MSRSLSLNGCSPLLLLSTVHMIVVLHHHHTLQLWYHYENQNKPFLLQRTVVRKTQFLGATGVHERYDLITSTITCVIFAALTSRYLSLACCPRTTASLPAIHTSTTPLLSIPSPRKHTYYTLLPKHIACPILTRLDLALPPSDSATSFPFLPTPGPTVLRSNQFRT